jgi:apolipoprotein N-acyltransferase
MTGALHLVRTDDAKKHFYNSAFIFTPQRNEQDPYNKHLIVPFGEHALRRENRLPLEVP